MTVKELHEIFLEFIENDFKHLRNDFKYLRKKVDGIFVFMLVAAAGTIGTLITTILFLVRQKP